MLVPGAGAGTATGSATALAGTVRTPVTVHTRHAGQSRGHHRAWFTRKRQDMRSPGHGHGVGHGRGRFRGPAAPLGPFLRSTGLPSRSALVAPALWLATLRWREALVVLVRSRPPSGVSTACLVAVTRFSGARLELVRDPRVREPGTAERGSAGLCPDSDRRMPGTRSSCSWSQASPLRPPMREFTFSAGHAKGRNGGGGASEPTGAVPGDRRSLSGPTYCETSSAAPGSATRAAENLR
jgi:hypothetical protein